MSEPLENAYFRWLCAKVIQNQQPSTPSLTYWRLLTILHSTEFVWLIQGDDNRAQDGIELRSDFMLECRIPDHPDWRALGCSVLEMLIAFSKRAEFMTEIPYREWFWEFIENLGLKEFNDGAEFHDEDAISIIDRFVWRTYDRNGEGGIVPITHAKEDQRHVQVWYQLCEYVVDRNKIPC